MIESTTFSDVEAAVVPALQTMITAAGSNSPLHSTITSNETPSPIPAKFVSVAYAGGGGRDWGEASANIGVRVYAPTDTACRALAVAVQDALSTISDDRVETIQVPAGGALTVPGQQPPFQRYFVATVTLRAQTDI